MSSLSVAPFTGAWIEILSLSKSFRFRFVAPFTGAWIEISLDKFVLMIVLVAPFTGAWIEIGNPVVEALPAGRRSLHGGVD